MRGPIFILSSTYLIGPILSQSIYEPSNTFCSQPVAAVPSSDPDEHVVNGDFEQYCQDLDNFTFTAVNRYLPFINPNGFNICESDIPNWYVDCRLDNTPDFFNKSGKGTLFPLYKIGTINFNRSYSFTQPIIETHKPNSNAFVGLYCHGPMGPDSSNERLINELSQNLLPGSSYAFSFWAITKPTLRSNQIYDVPSGVGLYVGDGTNWHLVVPQINISTTHTDSTTNDWGYYNRTFTIPSNITTNLSHIKVVNNSTLLGEPYRESYVLLDDISVKINNTANFPTYIYSPNYTDLTYQNHVIDQEDNIYVYGTQINGPIKTHFHNTGSTVNTSNVFTGSFIAKYDSYGNLIWDKLYPDVQIKELNLDQDDNVHFIGSILFSANYSNFITDLQAKFPSISLPTNNYEIETVFGSIYWQGSIRNIAGSSLPLSNGNIAFDIDSRTNYFALSLSTSASGNVFNNISISSGHNILTGIIHNGIPQFNSNHTSPFLNVYPNVVETIICDNNSVFLQHGTQISLLSNSIITPYANFNSPILDFKFHNNYLYALTKNDSNTYTLSKITSPNTKFSIKSYTNNTTLDVSPSCLTFKNGNIYVIGTLNDGTFLQNGTWAYSNRIFIEKLSPNYLIVWTKYSTQLQSTTHNLKHQISSFNLSNKLFFSSNFFPVTIPWKIKLDSKELLDTGRTWPFGNRNIVISTLEDFGTSASFKNVETNSSIIHPIPSSGFFYFDSKEFTILNVVNYSGNVMQISLDENMFTLTSPKPGIYFATFQDFSGNLVTEKLIVL